MNIGPWKTFNECKEVLTNNGFSVSQDTIDLKHIQRDCVNIIFKAPFSKEDIGDFYFLVFLEEELEASTMLIFSSEFGKKKLNNLIGSVCVSEGNILIDHDLRKRFGYSLKELYMQTITFDKFIKDSANVLAKV